MAGSRLVPSSGWIALPSNVVRIARAGHLEQRRHHVHHVSRLANPSSGVPIPFGQWAMNGVLMPPSCVKCL